MAVTEIDYERQEGLIDRHTLTDELMVVGAGALGSFITLAVAKMGYRGNIHVADNDSVEIHNLPNQFYKLSSVGRLKVAELHQTVRDYVGRDILVSPERITDIPEYIESVVFAVDDMDSRIQLFTSFMSHPQAKWLFDARMGGDTLRLYTVNMREDKDVTDYMKTLYTSAEADFVPCTQRATVYNACTVAGLICNQIRLAMHNSPHKFEIIINMRTMDMLTRNPRD